MDREIDRCAKGMAHIISKKNPTVVDHNHYEFLKKKSERLRGINNENNG